MAGSRALKIYVPMPGMNHMPRVPGWSRQLAAPDYQRIARLVDDLGFDALATPEHFAMPFWEVPRLGPYWLHGMTVMAFIAGATSRVRVDASVLVLPYYQPLALAKAITTLDVLSGGRLNISIGVGHAEAEFAALGVPFHERGRRADEILAAMHELWTAEEPSFHGEFYDIEGLAFEPKPLQQPRPPIYVGGNSKAALRRAARHDGWQPNPTDFSLADLPPLLEYLHDQPELAQKRDTFEICWLGGPPLSEFDTFASASAAQKSAYRDRAVEWFETLQAAGATRTSLPAPPTESIEEFADHLAWFAEEIGTQR
jgi:probable F420-dependent oxidoreductase